MIRARYGSAWWALWCALPAPGLATFERIYAYFRWADDVVDAPTRDSAEVREFVTRQRSVLTGERDPALPAELAIVAVLTGPSGERLRGALAGMLDSLRFDADRGPGPIPEAALRLQTERIGDGFVTALWVCAGEAGPLPAGLNELARAACVVHVLRDRALDRTLGYENRPPDLAGAPMDESAWIGALSADAERRFQLGELALAAPMRARTRWLLRRYAARYRNLRPARPA